MKKTLALLFILTSLILKPATSVAQNDYASKVNPFIGTGGHGHTYPGASAPFGMVQLSPDTRLDGWDGCSGYHYSDSVIYGFSHTHLSGTGVSDYGDILLMPIVTEKKYNVFDNNEYSSKFSHANESATAGYYSVTLDKFNIKVELTATQRAGLHRYTFPKTKKATVVIDLKHRDEVLDSYLVVVNDSTLKGLRRSKAWAVDQYVYFYIRFSKPFKNMTFTSDDKVIVISENQGKEKNKIQGKNVKAAFDFDAMDGEPILVKVGISPVSELSAQKNMEAELTSWNFEKVKAATRTKWNSELGKIEVKGKPDEEIIFYTALYHCMLNPNVYSDVEGNYRGMDLKIHNVKSAGDNWNNAYTVFSLWDTYRALHPLLSIIDTKRTNDFINTFLADYENGGLLPVWELSANETFCMIGYHSVPVITDAYFKGIRGYDVEKIYQAMKHSADTNLFGLECYRQYGFLSNDCDHESVSKTLEYAYDDWCIAQMAKALGKTKDYEIFTKRAQSYKNVFDPVTTFMRGKNNGMFHTPFEPSEVNNYYTEANSWQYSFYVPQDVDGLMKLHGGKKNFSAFLNSLFKADESLKGRQQADITGLIGQYAHGNEPSHHITYLYNYADEYWNTQLKVSEILKTFYKNAPDGLCGNEDCGQMSAWYVLSSMGFYQVCPGKPEYSIGTTIFDETKIHLENGKTFTINAVNRTDNNLMVGSMKLDNNPYNKSYITHDDILKGGNLTFYMQEFTSLDTSHNLLMPPATGIHDDLIVPAPFATNCEKVFRNKQTINIASIDNNSIIYVQKDVKNKVAAEPYKAFEINKTTTISYYAQAKDGSRSATIITDFVKIPDNRFIKTKQTFDPQYTASGDEALIDGVRGEINWRKGGWQGYEGKTLEAVVDLGKPQAIKTLGLGCLQDLSPWILYPSEIEFYVSDDNVTFKEVGTIKPTAPVADTAPGITEFKKDVNTSGRYVKVIAKPFGKLPAWHLSPGETAWMFVDEITVD